MEEVKRNSTTTNGFGVPGSRNMTQPFMPSLSVGNMQDNSASVHPIKKGSKKGKGG